MNATPPVSQTLIASDPAQQSPAAPANSVKSAPNEDFAAALSHAGAKPTRKAATLKPADVGSAGGHLPAPGILSPPPASPPGAGSAAASAAATLAGTLGAPRTPGAAGSTAVGTAIGVAAGTAAGIAAGIAAGTTATAGAQAKVADQKTGSASGDSPAAAAGIPGAVRPGAGSTLALGWPVGDLAAAPNADGAATIGAAAGLAAAANGAAAANAAAASAVQAGTAAGGGATVAAGTAAGTGAGMTTRGPAGVAAAATAHAGVATGAAARTAGKPITGAAAAPAINAAASGPPTSTTDGTTASSTNAGAWTSTDATTQAVTAAAMSAAASGAVAPGDTGIAGSADSPSTLTGELAMPATGPGGQKGPRVPAPAISVAGPVAAAAAKAAAAAPAAATLANAGAADKRASGGTGDSLLPGTAVDAVAGAAQLSGSTAGVTDTAPAPTLKVAAGVDTPEFGQGLADRVSWMVDNNLNGAKLQVNPPQLGPIEVRIAVQGSHAQVWLVSHSAVTRDALESSSPKLREMLGAQGFGQVSVDISQRSFQDRPPQPQHYDWTPAANHTPSTAAGQSTSNSVTRISNGAVDAYA
jgi:flagellar hook-length control protein FliK